MTTSNPISRAARRLLLPIALGLLAGCQSPRLAINVTSPAPPRFGSAPIAAYDAYALAINPPVETSLLKEVAQVYLR